jgi:hypothetical protein
LQFKFFLGLGLCLSIHLRWGCALCFVWMNSFAQWKWVSKWRCIWPSDIRVS